MTKYGIDPVWLMSGDEIEPKVARSPEIDFALINGVVGALDDELSRLGRQMHPGHRTRVIRALYGVALEQGRISPGTSAMSWRWRWHVADEDKGNQCDNVVPLLRAVQKECADVSRTGKNRSS